MPNISDDCHRKTDDMLVPNINEQFHLYPILLILSLVIGILIPSIKLAKAGMRKDILLCVAMLNMFLALFFGKIYTMVAEKSIDLIRTGFSSLGGLIGFLAGTYIFYFICDRDKKIPENYVISLPLIYAISKLGCFMAGCCHGIEYTGILNIRYEVGSACEVTTGVLPIQMIETIVFIGIYLLLNIKIANENKVIVTLLFSAMAKFLLDFFRYSHVGQILSFNQIVCVIIAGACILYRVIRGKFLRKK